MPNRRPLLALPLLLLARPVLARPVWAGVRRQADITEIRVGGVAPDAVAARLGIAVRRVTHDLVGALNEGHLEAAVLDPATAVRAAALMGDRLIVTAAGSHLIAVRRALPGSLRADLGTTLAALAG